MSILKSLTSLFTRKPGKVKKSSMWDTEFIAFLISTGVQITMTEGTRSITIHEHSTQSAAKVDVLGEQNAFRRYMGFEQ